MEALNHREACLINNDSSQPEDQADSKEIINTIRWEIMNGEFTRPIEYHGIKNEEPNTEWLSNRKHSIRTAPNCVFPEKYQNILIYDGEERTIHWFVVRNDPIL